MQTMAMPTVGQQIVYRLSSTRYLDALVSSVVSGDTVNLVAFGDGAAWGDGEPASLAARSYTSVALGTAVGEYQIGTQQVALITSIAETEAADAVASIPADDDSGLCAVPGAGSTPSPALALNTVRIPNATRPTLVTVSGTWAWSLSITGTVSGTVSLQSDSSSTNPTAVRANAPQSASGTLLVGLSLANTNGWILTYLVPAGHSYRVVTTGGGTFAITAVNETTL